MIQQIYETALVETVEEFEFPRVLRQSPCSTIRVQNASGAG
jgi:hypothetical protein